MGQTGHVKIGHNLKGDMCTSKDKLDSIVSKINTDLIEYVPKTLVKKEVRKTPNMLLLFSTVFSLYLFQPKTQYQIHTTMKDHKLIVFPLIYQNILV